MTKNYHYSVDPGAPADYEVLCNFNENYFMDKQGCPILRFAYVWGS